MIGGIEVVANHEDIIVHHCVFFWHVSNAFPMYHHGKINIFQLPFAFCRLPDRIREESYWELKGDIQCPLADEMRKKNCCLLSSTDSTNPPNPTRPYLNSLLIFLVFPSWNRAYLCVHFEHSIENIWSHWSSLSDFVFVSCKRLQATDAVIHK